MHIAGGAPSAKRFRGLLPILAVSVVAVAAAFLLAACGEDDEESTSSPTAAATSAASPAASPTTAATSAPSPAASPQVASSCPPAGSANALTGAGATFPNPLYSKWVDEFDKQCNVKINYQPIGSGGGIKQITEKTVDFGASDGIMTDEQTAAAEAAGGPILHIPMASGAVAVVFNLSGIESGQLQLAPDIVADIYLKKITKWDDERIAALNADLDLPGTDIAVVHRSDGSGTTFIFTNYLSKVSTEWSDGVGFATSVNWPGDIGGEGNAGVAAQVAQIPGAIGYVELAYAMQNDLSWAAIRNKSGKFVEPGLEATTAAAEGIPLADDMKVLLTDSDNPDAYPIAGFTWVLAYREQPDKAKGQALASYLWWSIHDGQRFTTDLLYAPLSAEAVQKAEAQIESITYQGQTLLQAP
jgi:phosphate transport system substrate-binding protein